MKFLIALALLAVVSALPPRHGFGHPHHEDNQLEGPSHHQDKHHQLNLIKLIYDQLIDNLNHPSQDDKEEEERAIIEIVNTINIIGHIIHDNINDAFDGPSKPQHPEQNDHEGGVPNKPNSEIKDLSNWNKEKKVPFLNDSKVEVISPIDELSGGDEKESSEVLVVENVLEDDKSDPNVSSFVNQKDVENPIIAYNSINVANEVPAF